MASSSLSNQFRITLVRVSRLLTNESVQQLAFLCNISPTRRRELEGAMDLFDQLQEYGMLNEKNVDILIGWLEELQLENESDLLKNYRQMHLEKNTEPKGNCIEHADELTYFCITCNSKLCQKCFFRFHRYSCDVIELEKLSQEMESRKAKLKEEFDSLQKLTANCEDLSQRNGTQSEISEDIKVMLTNTEKLAYDTFLKDPQGKKLQDTTQLQREGKETAKVDSDYQNLRKPNKKCVSRPKLPKIDGSGMTNRKNRGEVEWKQPDAKDGCYEDMSRHVTVGLPKVCCFVGGVMIRENQLVHVFSERQKHKSVLFVCIDPNFPRNEYWKKLVALNDNKSPVVMSYKELKYGGINHVLFAVGKKVFILHPKRTGSVYDSVHSVASLVIDDVGKESWITSIAAHRLQSECDEFIISVKGSNLLREYNISGKALRTIDTRGCVPFISSIAYVLNMFAVCGNRNDVYLVTTDSMVKQNVALQPLSDRSRLFPVCAIWTGGAGWMILFVGNRREEQVWRVSCYSEKGEHIKVCVEGTSPRDKGVPLSISRWGNTGFISFADSSVKTFDY